MKIYTTGDSHSRMYAFQELEKNSPDKYCCFMRAGALAYSTPTYVPSIIETLKSVTPEDCVIFAHGEVDTRNHVHKYVTKSTQSYVVVVDNIIARYVQSIIDIKKTINFNKTSILNVLPVKKASDKYDPTKDKVYPSCGTEEERKKYVEYFNVKLKEQCLQHGFIFFDIYQHVLTEDGYLIQSLSDGSVHLSAKCAPIYDEFIHTHIL